MVEYMNDDERIDQDKNKENEWDFRELDDVEALKQELTTKENDEDDM